MSGGASSQEQAATQRRFQERFFHPFVKELIPHPARPSAPLVDLGCGAGELSVFARDLGYEVTSLDLSPANVAAVRELGFRAQTADFNGRLPLDDEEFEVALLAEVIEHVVNAEHLLSEIHRVLRPGGRLVISTPNHAHYSNRFGALLGKPPKGEGYHFRFFTAHSLRRKLANAGFRIVASNSFNMDHITNEIRKALRLRGRHRRPVSPPAENALAHTLVYAAEKSAPGIATP